MKETAKYLLSTDFTPEYAHFLYCVTGVQET